MIIIESCILKNINYDEYITFLSDTGIQSPSYFDETLW